MPADPRNYACRMRKGTIVAIAAIVVSAAGCGSSAAPVPPPRHSVVSANLTGATPLPKGERHASGTAVLGLNAGRKKICWTIVLTGVHAPLSAQLRKAPAHKTGPVIVSFGQRFARSGCVPVSAGVVTALGKHPSAYYIDVATRRNLEGLLRGQLHAGG